MDGEQRSEVSPRNLWQPSHRAHGVLWLSSFLRFGVAFFPLPVLVFLVFLSLPRPRSIPLGGLCSPTGWSPPGVRPLRAPSRLGRAGVRCSGLAARWWWCLSCFLQHSCPFGPLYLSFPFPLLQPLSPLLQPLLLPLRLPLLLHGPHVWLYSLPRSLLLYGSWQPHLHPLLLLSQHRT